MIDDIILPTLKGLASILAVGAAMFGLIWVFGEWPEVMLVIGLLLFAYFVGQML